MIISDGCPSLYPPAPFLYPVRSLWHGLRPAGDGVEMGTCLSNGMCPPAPKPSSIVLAQTEGAGDASEQPLDAVCTLEVYMADPYR